MNEITGFIEKTEVIGQIGTGKMKPLLEDIVITPKAEEQNFVSSLDGFNNVTVKAVEAQKLNVTPKGEEQVFKGIYNEVSVSGVVADTLNVIPTKNKQHFEGFYNEVYVDKVTGDTLNVSPTDSKQSFNGLYETVNVDAIKSDTLTVTPNTEEQVFKGLYNQVTVDPIEGDTLNVIPTMEEQSFTGVYEQVNVGKIEAEPLTIVPSSKEQNFSGLYGNITALPISTEIIVSYEEPTGENRKAFWLQKGKNLYPIHIEMGGYYNTNAPNRAVDLSNYPIKAGHTYTFSTTIPSSSDYIQRIILSENKFPTLDFSEMAFFYNVVFVNYHTFTPEKDGYFTIELAKKDDSEFLEYWKIDDDSKVTKINKNYSFMLEEGSEATEYEPYIEPKLYMLNDNNEYVEFN